VATEHRVTDWACSSSSQRIRKSTNKVLGVRKHSARIEGGPAQKCRDEKRAAKLKQVKVLRGLRWKHASVRYEENYDSLKS